MNGQKQVDVLKPLLLLCNFLAIVNPNQKSLVYKIYAVAFQVIFLGGFIHSAYGKQSSLFDSYASIAKLVDQIANLFLTLACITSTTLTIFYYPKRIQKLFKDLRRFDSRNSSVCKNGYILLRSVIIILHLSAATVIFWDLWVIVKAVGFNLYKFYVVFNFQFYYLSVIVLLVFWMTMEFRYRFMSLNQALEEVAKNVCSSKWVTVISKEHVDKSNCYTDVKHIARMHNFLCDVLDDFNGVFGFVILFAVLFFITYMVQYAVELIIFTVMNHSMNGATFGLGLQLVSVSWILQCMITLLALAAAGDFLFEEATKTSAICYNILNEIDMSRPDLQILKGELKLLAQQVSCRRPCLTASGFFVVNLSMMGFIVTSVTSYIIVAIQFLT